MDFMLTSETERFIFCAAMRRNHNPNQPRYIGTGAANMSKSKLLFAGIICFTVSSVVLANGIPTDYQQCQPMDLDNDGIIAFEDMATFALNWLVMGEGLTGDFDDSNLVDCNDLSIFSDCWLKGTRPLYIWEQFRAALSVHDINKALTFMSEILRDKYSHIFQIIEPNLPNFAAGMGDLILKSDSQNEGEEKYEMKHRVGPETYLFPVRFIKDVNDSWKIHSF